MGNDIFHYKIVEEYNSKKFEGIINVNANIGFEMAIPNPDYKKGITEDLPPKLYYYPILIGKVTYLLKSEDIESLPVKVLRTTKIPVGARGYERIDEAISVKLTQKKCMEYKEFIDSFLPYEHEQLLEWKVWKIICDVAIRDKIFIRAISYPAWGKTSTFYVWNQLRNDVEIIDGGTFAKMKHSLSVKPSSLVLDEVDDVSNEEKRFLSKLFRSCGDGRGKINNDSRSVGGTTEVFDLVNTSIIALYNFPNSSKSAFFETNFHEKIIDRLFPLLLNGGSADRSPMKHKHVEPKESMTLEDKDSLDKFLRTSLHYQHHQYEELMDTGKLDWEPNNKLGRKRWQNIYKKICNGLKLDASTQEEFHLLEQILYSMHVNYLAYKEQFLAGDHVWRGEKNDMKVESVKFDSKKDLGQFNK